MREQQSPPTLPAPLRPTPPSLNAFNYLLVSKDVSEFLICCLILFTTVRLHLSLYFI